MWVNVYEDSEGYRFLAHVSTDRGMAVRAAERENNAIGTLICRLKINVKRGEGLTAAEMSQLSEKRE